ncbi:MAG TPA: hypothetical protein VGG69_09685 [Rhizomicrobium sp.]
MSFLKRLREPIAKGEIDCTIRIWQRPQVKVGGRYQMERGFVRITRMRQITLHDITPELARRGGFSGVVDLLKTAQHGQGEKVYLIEFVYEEA